MTMFSLFAALMLAAALAFVLVPLLRHGRGATSRPLRALDEALAAGVIDADEHARKRATLGAAPAAPSRSTFASLLLVALLLPASALLLYRFIGAPQALDPASFAAAPATGEQAPDMEQAIALLAARLEEKPDDAEGWALLGRAYQSTSRTTEALAAFKRAHEAEPGNPVFTVEYAQALAMARPDHRIEGEARALLEGVLQADASNQRALWLLGISDYQAQRYEAAIARWNTLLPLLEAGSTVQLSVKNQITEAEALRDGQSPGSGATTAASASAAPAGAMDSTPSTADAPRLTVRVTLDPKLRDRLDADASLFVFARAASGPPMPLAIERLKAAQLPLTVTLDESKGMLPNLKLSMFPQVIVGARVSKSGEAIAQSGDLQALSAPIDVGRKDEITLTIDQVVQ